MPARIGNAAFVGFSLALAALLGSAAYHGFVAAGPSATASASHPIERGTIEIVLRGLAFRDGARTVASGAVVRWKNDDDTAHTVSSNDNSFDSGNEAAGGTYAHKFTNIGKYDYFCKIHPFMKGSILVVVPYGG